MKVWERQGEVIPANAGEDAAKLVDKLGHFPSSSSYTHENVTVITSDVNVI